MIMTILRATLLAATAAFAQTPPPVQTPPPAQSQPQAQPPAQSQTPVRAAPSFDCNRAASVVEKEICAISEFADLDSRIATLFSQAQTIVSARDAEALRADQRVWLRERDGCGNLIHGNPPVYIDVYACLRDQLNRREGLLRVVVASKQFTKP
jgi:uncharacterized protein YecT (DUF1311 family)